jgi:hypothetical protein
MSSAADLSRPEMLDVARGLLSRLRARKKKGPKEEALDGFIPQLKAVVKSLETHVDGKSSADAARRAALAALDVADADVDAWLRHHEGFIWIEANRRNGPHAAEARATYDAAFPDGLAHVDDHIPDENRLCRASIAVLRAPEHAATMKAIGLPADWTTKWEAAIDLSDARFAEVAKARLKKSAHAGAGLDAEADFVDLAVRLRRYVGSRASRRDTEKVAEGNELLAPLVGTLKKAEQEKATRATKKKAKGKAKPKPDAKPATTTTP